MKLPLLSFLLGILCFNSNAQLPSFSTSPYVENGFVCYNTHAIIKANVTSSTLATFKLQVLMAGSYFDTGHFGNIVDDAITIQLSNYTGNETYKVVLTNTTGSVESSPFAVSASPQINVQPINQTQCYGEDIYFFVDQNPNFTYVWERSNNGGGFTSSGFPSKLKNKNTYALWIDGANTAERDDAFRCKITDSNGCVNTSNAGQISINYFGTIQPTATQELCEGDTVSFSTSGIDGTVDSFDWSSFDVGDNAITGLSEEEISSTSYKVKGAPTNLKKVALALTFSNSLMLPNGTSSSGTCAVTRNRDNYIVNPKPEGLAVTKADSVCGEGSMTLELTDAKSDWNWSTSKYGTVSSTTSSLITEELTESKYYYVWHTDANGCKSNADSVLAKVNPLPEVTLGSIDDICPGATSFHIPYANLSGGTDVFSMSLNTGNVGFTSISESTITSSPLSISLLNNVVNGDNTFDLTLKNSGTGCESSILPASLHINLPTVVTSSPTTLSICESTSHTFNVAGTGEGTLSYEWYFKGNPIPSTNSNSYGINNGDASNEGNYYCKITALCGTTASDTASLTVTPKTRINTHPQDVEVCAGRNAQFTISATGTGTLHYQWKKDNQNIGTDGNSLDLVNVLSTDNGAKISCLVSSDCGDSLSIEATLTVLALPIIPTVVDTGYCINATASALKATALTNHSLLWYGNSDINGVGSAIAPSPATHVAGDFIFYVSQIDTKNCESPRAALNVSISPELIVSLTSQIPTICPGGLLNKTSILTAAASDGTSSYTYQWGKETANIDGETNSTYAANSAGSYYVITTSGYCQSISYTSIQEAVFDFTAPAVTSALGSEPYELCIGANIELTASTSGGGEIRWYNSPTSTFPISVSEILNANNVLSSTIYYAAAQQNIGLLTCETIRKAANLNTISNPTITALVSSTSCPESSDGKIELTPNPVEAILEYKFGLAVSYSATNTFDNLTAGVYPINIQNSKGCLADTSITVGSLPLPVFTTHPSNAVNCDGNLVNFDIETNAVFNIQWQKMLPGGTWADIDSETDLRLRVTNVGSSTNPNGTKYRAKAGSNSCFSFSEEATLLVNEYTSTLDDQTACAGNTVTLAPPSTNGIIKSYQWQKSVGNTSNFTVVQDSPSANLVLLNVGSADSNTYYRVRITFETVGSSTCVETSDDGKLLVNTPSQTILSGPADVCVGEKAILVATGCNGQVVWSNASIGTSISVSPVSDITYTAVCKVGECTLTASNSLTIGVKPGISGSTISVTNASYCFGDSATLNASQCLDGVLWSNNTTVNPLIIKGLGIASYSVKCTGNGCTSPSSDVISITGNPELIPGTIAVRLDTNCAGYNPSTISSELDVSGGKGSKTVSWEKSENCSSLSPVWEVISGESGSSYNPDALQTTTCFRRKVEDDCKILYSNVYVIHIAVDPIVTLSTSKATICSNEAFVLTANIEGGAGACTTTWQQNLKSSSKSSSYWEDIAGSGFTNAISNVSNAETETATVYFRAIYDCSLSSCNKATSDAIAIEVLPSSEVTLNFTDSTACIGNTVNIVASNCGGTLTWNDASTDLIKEVIVSNNVSYTATCYSICGTYSATANITAIPGLSAPTNSTPFSAIVPNALNFSAIGDNLKWYASATIDTTLSSAPIETEIGNYIYWVSQSNLLCESPRLAISGTVYSPLAILQQPYDAYKCEGNSVKFYVEATGAGKLFYQWQRKRPGETDFVNILNEDDGIKYAQQPWLTVSAIGDKDNPNLSQYKCIITDSLTAIASEIKTLYANVINRTLPNLDACVGQDFDIKLSDYVEVIGSVYAYQWQRRDDVEGEWKDLESDYHVAGVKTSVLKFHDLNNLYQGKYRCRIYFNTGGLECIESTDQTYLTVGDYPQNPPNLSEEYCVGETTRTLNVRLTPHTDVWYLNGDDAAIGTTRGFKPSSDSAGVFTFWYTARSKDKCETPKSTYTITVHPSPLPPGNKTPLAIPEGDTLTFDAYGANLQWYRTKTTRTSQVVRPFFTEIDDYKFYVTQVSEFGCESDRVLIESSIYGNLGFKTAMEDKADCDGNSVRFISNGKGPGTLKYTWKKKRPGEEAFVIIEGENETTLSVTNIGSKDNPNLTQFMVEIADSAANMVFSNIAFLRVNELKGALNDQWYCDADYAKVRLENFEIQGDVNQLELQFQDGRSWVTLDSAYLADSNWTKKDLHYFTTLEDTLLDKDFKLRVVFNAENGGTCARSSNEFSLIKAERPEHLGTSSVKICQNTLLEMQPDTLSYQWFANVEDSSRYFNFEKSIGITAGKKEVFYVVEDTVTGCFSEKELINLTVLPADSVKLGITEFAYCTEDALSLFVLDDVLSYRCFQNDSSLTSIGDSLFIDQKISGDTSFLFQAFYENGCFSPIEKLNIKVESCESEAVVSTSEDITPEEVVGFECSTFPNPFRSIDNVELVTKNLIFDEVSIYDSQGFSVEHKLNNGPNQKLSLNSDLKAGVYILKILDLNGNHCEWKMVKSR
jgi:hypothetical protein